MKKKYNKLNYNLFNLLKKIMLLKQNYYYKWVI